LGEPGVPVSTVIETWDEFVALVRASTDDRTEAALGVPPEPEQAAPNRVNPTANETAVIGVS
jgi:hypothetical protein